MMVHITRLLEAATCLAMCLVLAPTYPRAAISTDSMPTREVLPITAVANSGVPDPATDVLGFLRHCLKHYHEQKLTGYTLIFRKQERVKGILRAPETIEVVYREQPHSIFFNCVERERDPDRPVKAFYVEGENKNGQGTSQIVARINAGLTVKIDPNDANSKKASRYPLNECGLKQATQRVLQTWEVADNDKTLHVTYLGLHEVPETGNRICHKIHRHTFDEPEGDDGVADVIVYIDRETLFQVGTIVSDKDGELLGKYYFRDIRLNPEFAPEQFTLQALKK